MGPASTRLFSPLIHLYKTQTCGIKQKNEHGEKKSQIPHKENYKEFETILFLMLAPD
jgi:hypothetical protein